MVSVRDRRERGRKTRVTQNRKDAPALKWKQLRSLSFALLPSNKTRKSKREKKTLVVQLNHQELKKLLFVVGERMRERIREKERRLVHSRA